ncbi:right-handed parallel beta-helix repeat-containing protein [Clostridium estertheticum]|uniref:right-handed parallel beta-helix repeat-containing protein n=1 Tax=Clostridium estertheticum TaxID=238834 RepID=UPI001C0CF972|nr:right-handed parallel beta-helix repeat-containing protein [Clostridium estertheticum]MBU3075824.1 right-handed parallel beta-helix repeat-containing protein [Clostridium estertheticum]MBU3166059.1 right-handed parallel beta-helix repeat-containing protein [Clostridium estertheticum]
MQRFKNLCMVAAIGAIVMGGSLLQSTSAYAASPINVKAGGTTLSSALASAKAGDTIAISGTITSGSVVVPAGVTISGKAGTGKINFSSTTGSSRGLTINTSGSTITDLEIYGAADNGIYMEGSSNRLTNLKVHGNHDAGVQLSNGAASNTLTNVYSYSNADAKGENADGFAVKLHSGVGNNLIDCTAEGNSDDGYDLYAANGAVTFTRCKAINNGNCGGIKGDGNGFKVGGVDNKTPGKPAFLNPLEHVLINCTATGNTGSGFDRNNQSGIVTMTGCIGQNNGKNNFNFPLTGTPSALGYKVTFGKAIMKNCTSKNGTNNITGATLSGCIGF